MSKEMVVIADESKMVDEIGKFPLPVEIIPFALPATIRHLNDAGFKGELRRNANGKPFMTENANVIYDIHLTSTIKDPKLLQDKIIYIPGIVDTGLFIGYAGRIIIGKFDGSVEIRQ
jgi:ribose 5-phosphate isomerase A